MSWNYLCGDKFSCHHWWCTIKYKSKQKFLITNPVKLEFQLNWDILNWFYSNIFAFSTKSRTDEPESFLKFLLFMHMTGLIFLCSRHYAFWRTKLSLKSFFLPVDALCHEIIMALILGLFNPWFCQLHSWHGSVWTFALPLLEGFLQKRLNFVWDGVFPYSHTKRKLLLWKWMLYQARPARRERSLNGWYCISCKRSILGETLHWLGRQHGNDASASFCCAGGRKTCEDEESLFCPDEQSVTWQCRMGCIFIVSTWKCGKPVLLLVLNLENHYAITLTYRTTDLLWTE